MKHLIFALFFISFSAFSQPIMNWEEITGLKYKNITLKIASPTDMNVYVLDNFPCYAMAGNVANTSYNVGPEFNTTTKIKCVFRPDIITLGYKEKKNSAPSYFSNSSKIDGIFDCPVQVKNKTLKDLSLSININECQKRPITDAKFSF